MARLQKLAGIAAVANGLIYLIAFVYFGAFLSFPVNGTPIEQMTYLAQIQLPFSVIYFMMYVLFGVFLAVLVVGLHEKLKRTNNPAVAIGALLGGIWVGLVIASGMIATIGLDHAIKLMDKSPERAFELWTTLSVITESLGGGNELLGGLWILLMSVAAMKISWLPRALNGLGCFVGLSGIATLYPDDFFTELFGVTQMVWFIWLGGYLFFTHSTHTQGSQHDMA